MKNGIIHYFNLKNSLFIIKLPDDTYSVFETNQVGAFKVNDQISGYLDQTGIYEILNGTSQKYHFVNIEKVGLSLEEAMELTRANQ